MRISSRVAVGSPTARVSAVLATTLLIAILGVGALVAGAAYLAGSGPIVVAQDGSGTYTTITEAVAAAEDGDTILVRPGTYVEVVAIDKTVTVAGDGARETIIVEAPEDGPRLRTGRAAEIDPGPVSYAVLIDGSDPTLRGLTLRGVASSVHIRNAAPTLEDLLFDGVGIPCCGDTGARRYDVIVLTGESSPTIARNTFIGTGVLGIYDGSAPRIDGNTFTGGGHIWGNPGIGAVIRKNTISDTMGYGISVYGPRPVDALIEGNTISAAEGVGIEVGFNVSAGVDPVIRDNTIEGGSTGINVVGEDARPTIERNVVRGSETGIFVGPGASATIEGNRIEANEIGLGLAPSATPVLVGNMICDNRVNVAADGSTVSLDGNTICPNGSAEPG
jgi:hypothetical protein